MGFQIYESLHDFDDTRRGAVVSVLGEKEEFVFGVDVDDSIHAKRWGTKLVVTDHRIISVKKTPRKKEIKDFTFEMIDSIEYYEGKILKKVAISGLSFNKEYYLRKNHGTKFVSRTREKMQETDTLSD